MKPAFCIFLALMVSVKSIQCQDPGKISNGGLWTIDISHDDKYVALGGDDSLLRIYSRDLQLYKTIKLGKRGMLRAVQWHPKVNILAIATRNDIWILDPETEKETVLEGMHNGSRTICWNYSGEMLATAGGGGTVWIWNREGKLLNRFQKRDANGKIDTNDFLGIDWHPSKNVLVTVGDEIRLFDTSGIQYFSRKHREQRAGLLTVKWHPSGNLFVTGDYGHSNEGIPTLLQFWKADGTLLREIKESKKELRNIRWNKEGTMLATASDALRIWSPDGNLLYSSQPVDAVLWGVDWLSDSRKIFTVSFDTGKIETWTATATLLSTQR